MRDKSGHGAADDIAREKTRPATARRRWVASILAGGVAVAVILPAALYLGRRPIAEQLAQRWLEQHHLPGALEVQSIGLTGLTARLRLGPKDDPDLTVERLQVDYALAVPWGGRGFALSTRAVHLFRPRLKARFVDGRLDLGSLTLLVHGLSGRPGAPGRPPDVTVDEGLVRLITPGGALTIAGDGAMTAGALTRIDARMAPFALAFGGTRIAGAEETLHVTRQGDRLVGSAEGGALALARAGDTWRSAGQSLSADLPAPERNGRITGPARLTIQAHDVNRGGLDGVRTNGGDLAATLTGTLGADGGGLTFDRVSGEGLLAVRSLQVRDIAIDGATAKLAIDQAQWAGRGFRMSGRLAAAGQGRMDPELARRVAMSLPVLSAAPAYRVAAQTALRAFRISAARLAMTISNEDTRLALTAPVLLESASGARLAIAGADARFAGDDVSGAGGRLTLHGGGLPEADVRFARWSSRPADLQADLAVAAQLDLPIAEGVSLRGRGRLEVAGADARFELADCGAASAKRLPLGDSGVVDVAGRICPAGGPLAQTMAGGWRARGRIEGVHATAPKLAVDLTDGAADFSAERSGGAALIVMLTAAKGRLFDASAKQRFNPVMASGEVALEHETWTGDFAAATPAGRSIGTARLTHNGATGEGRIDIDASRLSFVPGGLQPSDLTPLANFAKDAMGPLAFTGWVGWGRSGPLTSGGELVARNLTFKSPAGKVLALDSDLRLASLAPLVGANDQQITVREVQTSIPLTRLAATVDFDDQAATIDAASASFAGGQLRLEPMTAPFAPDSAYRGVLVFDHVNLGQIVATSNLSHVITLQALVDGRIPFEISPVGVRIISGHLAAEGPGRLSISRTALGGVSASQITAKGAPAQTEGGGLARDLAYDAMEDLAFDTLDASLDSIANDRLRILFHIRGRHDPPTAVRAQIALGDLIAGKAFGKPIPLPSGTEINLTLDSTLNFGELIRSLEQAWRDRLATPRSATVQDGTAQIPSTMETTRP